MSGTGNTLRAADWMADELSSLGIEAEVKSVEAEAPPREPQLGARHLAGFLMPTHGFTAPWLMLKVVARLPRGSGTHAFIMAIRGALKVSRLFTPGLAGTALYLVALILGLKGYLISD